MSKEKDNEVRNEFEENIQKGLQKLRELGITFTEFKNRVSVMHTNPKVFDEDDWVRLYKSYAEGVCKYYETIEEFATNSFQDFTDDEHETQLKIRP